MFIYLTYIALSGYINLLYPSVISDGKIFLLVNKNILYSTDMWVTFNFRNNQYRVRLNNDIVQEN